MGRKAIYDYDQLAVDLYEELTNRPMGMDKRQIAEYLDVPLKVASHTITRLRLELGDGDSIMVPIRHEGTRQVYFLSAQKDEAQAWLETRARTQAAKIKTEVATFAAMVRGADGRTTDGKLARMLSMQAQQMDQTLTAYLTSL